MRVKVAAPCFGHAELEAASRVLAGGQLFQGPEVEGFELEFAEYIGAANAVAVNSGTTSLYLTLWALGIGEGDEVVVPALTFFATVEAVMLVGATPVFADVDRDTHTMCPRDLALRITKKTRAVIPVHLYGGAADLVGINECLATHRTLDGLEMPHVIEDCAQAIGTKTAGGELVGAGHYSSAACFSFMATKHITTIEGGMVTTDSGQVADELRLLRNHGMTSRHHHSTLGGNFRLNDVGAAIGRVQLARFEEMLANRRAACFSIITGLEGVDWLVPAFDPDGIGRHSWFWLPYVVDEGAIGRSVDEVLKLLERAKVGYRYRYLEPLYKQPAVRALVPENYRLGNAERIAGKVIGLPCRADMTPEEIDHVIGVVHSIKKPRSILPGRMLGRGR